MTPDQPGDVDTGTLVQRFARDVEDELLTDHAVASPLGLWLLLALLAPASTGQERAALEAVLGTTAPDAARRAADLLEHLHPAVAAAVAVWADEARSDAPFAAWAGTLPGVVERGPIPSQAEADRWAAERTRGLVPRLPAEIEPLTVVVLASALVTDVAWQVPFEDAEPAELGGPFGAQATAVLRAPGEGHEQLLAWTRAAGVVAAHAADSADGLRVVSVIAAPDVPPADVRRAAAEVADLLSGRVTTARRESLFDQPLGAGHAWVLTEQTERAFASPARRETITSVLPAWSASSTHDLDTAPGVPAAFATLDGFLAPHLRPGRFDATQVAAASYRRDGFTGAAVTVVHARAAGLRTPTDVVHRHAHVTFHRPYAVLAVARGSVPDAERPWEAVDLDVPAWADVPVFSAWVARPDA